MFSYCFRTFLNVLLHDFLFFKCIFACLIFFAFLLFLFAVRAEKLLALSVQQQNTAKATLKDHEQERSKELEVNARRHVEYM